ncbi:MAG: glycosyltransferase [Candidatus Margulisiibacteriota bacterium]
MQDIAWSWLNVCGGNRTPYISVVIPAYNEAERIVPTLKQIWNFTPARGRISQVIVVDDGSKDATRAVVERYKSEHVFNALELNPQRKNRGKGFSVREGAELSTGDFMLFMDADNSTKISNLDKLMPFCLGERGDEYDIAIGSRALTERFAFDVELLRKRFLGMY